VKLWGNHTNRNCEGNGKNFLTPISLPIGEMGAQKIFYPDGALPGQCTNKILDPKFYVGWGRNV